MNYLVSLVVSPPQKKIAATWSHWGRGERGEWACTLRTRRHLQLDLATLRLSLVQVKNWNRRHWRFSACECLHGCIHARASLPPTSAACPYPGEDWLPSKDNLSQTPHRRTLLSISTLPFEPHQFPQTTPFCLSSHETLCPSLFTLPSYPDSLPAINPFYLERQGSGKHFVQIPKCHVNLESGEIYVTSCNAQMLSLRTAHQIPAVVHEETYHTSCSLRPEYTNFLFPLSRLNLPPQGFCDAQRCKAIPSVV